MSRDKTSRYIENIVRTLSVVIMNYYIGIGNSCEDTTDIYKSFDEAHEALLQAKRWRQSSIIWYDQYYQKEEQAYDFSYAYVNKLFNLLVSGESIEAYELLEHLIDTNFSCSSKYSNNENYTQFIFDIKGVLLRVISRIGMYEVMESISLLNDNITLDILITQSKELFEKIAVTVRGHQQNGLLQEMLDFIDTNYSDSNMSLKLLSSKFQLTEKYISIFFKERTGCNFSDYIEGIRLDKAEELIKEGKHSISDIAIYSGYSTTSTFYKAFKRKNGLTPLQWKKTT